MGNLFNKSAGEKALNTATQVVETDAKYKLFQDFNHSKMSIHKYFYSKENVDDLSRDGYESIVLERNDSVGKYSRNEISREALIKDQNNYHLSARNNTVQANQLADFIDYAREKGIEVIGIDVQQDPYQSIYRGLNDALYHQKNKSDATFGEFKDKGLKMFSGERAEKFKHEMNNLTIPDNTKLNSPKVLKAIKEAEKATNFSVKEATDHFTIGDLRRSVSSGNKKESAAVTGALDKLEFDDKTEVFHDQHFRQALEQAWKKERLDLDKELARKIVNETGGKKTAILYGASHGDFKDGKNGKDLDEYLADHGKVAKVGLVERKADLENQKLTQPSELPATIIVTDASKILPGAQIRVYQHDGKPVGGEVNMKSESVDQYIQALKPLNKQHGNEPSSNNRSGGKDLSQIDLSRFDTEKFKDQMGGSQAGVDKSTMLAEGNVPAMDHSKMQQGHNQRAQESGAALPA